MLEGKEMNSKQERDLALINPNWSAFILLLTLLSLFNQFARFILPIPPHADSLLNYINFAISLFLWADFIYLLRRSPNNWRFMTRQYGWMVLLGSFPTLRIFRLLWFWLILRENKRSMRDFLSGIVIRQDAQGTLLFVLFIVIVVFEFSVVSILSLEETQPDATIKSVSDAVWWALVTVSTVGYGDEYPVTNGGRIIALLLMAVGIALFSVITGSLADWFSSGRRSLPLTGESNDNSPPDEQGEDSIAEIRRLIEEHEDSYQGTIRELKARLDELESDLK
jgi:voltage-gated potassium channel